MGDGYPGMLLQILTALLCFPVIFYLYRSDWKLQKPQYGKKETKRCLLSLRRLLLICLAAAFLAVALNNLISLTALKEASKGYQRVTEKLFADGIWLKLIGTAVVTPILEETLYRGLVYKRLRRNQGAAASILISSVIFGIMHFNLVQFIYAGLIGLFLAFVFETEKGLYVPVIAHGVANAVAVLRTELGCFDFMYQSTALLTGSSLIMLVIAAIIIWYVGQGHFWKHNSNTIS